MTKKISGNRQLKLAITSGLIMTVISFFVGFYWNTGRMQLLGVPSNIFTCLSYNNFSEAYQMDCFLPEPQKQFVMKEEVYCTAYTNQNFGKGIWRVNDKERNTMTFSKSDYYKFKLQFKDNEIVYNPNDHKETMKYEIINETPDVIQGHYKSDSSSQNADAFITISKNYGKGMEVWHNKEWYGDTSIGSFFFQCE